MFKFIVNIILYIWQLPQNIIGLIYKVIIRHDIITSSTGRVDNVEINYRDTIRGAVSLGNYIFIYARYSNLYYLLLHEKGHCKQSKILGPLYLIVIGIPSIIWASIHNKIAPNKSYYWFYTESWANKLAEIKIV